MKIIMFLAMMACNAIMQAQTATATAGNVTVTAKVSSKQETTTKVSVSVSDSDNSYALHATFDTWKTKKIEKLLSENLDSNLFSKEKNAKVWKKENNGETAYSFILKEGRLKASIDKELVSKSTLEKLQALADKISEALSDN